VGLGDLKHPTPCIKGLNTQIKTKISSVMKTAPNLLVKLKCKYRYILIYILAMFMVGAAQSEDIQIKD
jgi:hypothetical protein